MYDARPSFPPGARLQPFEALVYRCGRLLHNAVTFPNGSFATLGLHTLLNKESPAVKAALAAPGRPRGCARLLARVVAILHVGFTFEPAKDKSRLKGETPEDLALRAFFSAEGAGQMPAGTDVRMSWRASTGGQALPGGQGWSAAPAASSAPLVQPALDWAVACHRAHDREALVVAPPGRLGPFALLTLSDADAGRLHLPPGGAATAWVSLCAGAAAAARREVPAGPGGWPHAPPLEDGASAEGVGLLLKVPGSLAPRRPSTKGAPRALPCQVLCFVTHGGAADAAAGAATCLAIAVAWDTPPDRRPVLRAAGGSGTTLVQNGVPVTPAALELRDALLFPASNLLEPDGAGGAYCVLSAKEFGDAAAKELLARPGRIATLPAEHLSRAAPGAVLERAGANAFNPFRGGAKLPHGLDLRNRWLAVAVLCDDRRQPANRRAPAEGGASPPSKHWFNSGVLDKLVCTVAPADGDGDDVRVPITSEACAPAGATTAGETTATMTKHVFYFQLSLANGLLDEPGSYTLTFAPADGAAFHGHRDAVQPLTIALTREAAPVPRALALDLVWAACCHQGECPANRQARADAQAWGAPRRVRA